MESDAAERPPQHMRLHYLEIATLYLCAVSVGLRICIFGFIYHDPVIIGAGTLSSGFAMFRTGEAVKAWTVFRRAA